MTVFQYTSKAIPCSYNGLNFRSLLEGRIAYFFDKMGFSWEYEPFELDGYIPDFIINSDTLNPPCIIDVKPFFDEGYTKEVLLLLQQQMKGKGFNSFNVAFMKGVEKFSDSRDIHSRFVEHDDLEFADTMFEILLSQYGSQSITSYGVSNYYEFHRDNWTQRQNGYLLQPVGMVDLCGMKMEQNHFRIIGDVFSDYFTSFNKESNLLTCNARGSLYLDEGHLLISVKDFFEASKYVQEAWTEAQNHFQYKGKTPQLVVVSDSLAA